MWLDGEQLGGHVSGYTPYRFHLDASRLAGRTVVLAARIDATKPDSWWYDGGGIYRSVWLTIASPVHIEPWGVYAPALVTSAIARGCADAQLIPSVEIANEGPLPAHITVDMRVREAASGDVAASGTASVTVHAGGSAVVNHSRAIELRNASLWSLESPALYILRTALIVEGQVGPPTTLECQH